MGPRDDYTPHGYLANPAARASDWAHPRGGTLRTPLDRVGFGWQEPTDRRPTACLDLTLELGAGERAYATREEWQALGLRCPRRSIHQFDYAWETHDVVGALDFCLAGAATLLARVRLKNRAPFPRLQRVVLAACLAPDGLAEVAEDPALPHWRWTHPTLGQGTLALLAGPTPTEQHATTDDEPVAALPGERCRRFAFAWTVTLPPGADWTATAALRRGGDGEAWPDPQAAYTAADAADAAFYATAALLAGDWPDHWRRGWVYDAEATRLCLRPAGGVFHGQWPAWMANYPRAVLAEGSLDTARLGYLAPHTAMQAMLTLFRDAPAPNVPCVFEGGEPNMVAKDGSVCGTSPAWCLPFHNIEILYRWTLDRTWLGELYPYLAAYLNWWLLERVDSDGWVVYRCTWEAGEDNTPRLDPAGEGDHVITEFTRPVELQATMAQSANVLARFASALGRDDEVARWLAIHQNYAARTQRLWDDSAGRFRDWDKRADAFVTPTGCAVYWDADPARYSPLSLTALLDGLATTEQARRMGAELPAYATAPWCDWPSWSHVITEAAAAVGYHRLAADIAYRIVERCWRRVDRRDTSGYSRPTPGVAPEYWPTDVLGYTGSDGYGWGANGLALFLRRVLGVTEAEETDGWTIYLTPGLPDELLQPGSVYTLRGLLYRQRRLDLSYQVRADRGLAVVLAFDRAVALRVKEVQETVDDPRALAVVDLGTSRTHTWPVERWRRYRVSLGG